MDKDLQKMLKLEISRRGARFGAIAKWLAAVAGLSLLLVAAGVALAAPSYAGHITVSAGMGSFSPNPVEVNSTATSTLKAGYTPPPGVPEDDLPSAYTWTASVLYKATLNAKAYGTPPANSYTDSIAPKQPANTGQATLSFTPTIAGYWEISSSCAVTATDTKTNKYWTGTGAAGPDDLTSYILHINYGGGIVDNKTQDVSVGEQIPLMATYGPADMTLQWKIKGPIIANYEANDLIGKIDPVTAADLTKASLTYYWIDTDSGQTENEQVTLTGTLAQPKAAPSVNTTFNVFRPVPTFTTKYLGPIKLIDPTVYDGDLPGTVNGPGIEFDYSVAGSGFGTTDNLHTVQIASPSATTKQYNVTTQKTTVFQFSLPSTAHPGPLLDTTFPYGRDLRAGKTDDSPYYRVDPPPPGSGFGPGTWRTVSVYVMEAFTHYLLFKPNLPSATYAPLSYVQWAWDAEVYNGATGSSGFTLTSSAQAPVEPPAGQGQSALPTWNGNAADYWPNPQWSVVP